MAITFQNNFKNILTKLKNIMTTEFGNSFPVVVGQEDIVGNQYIRLEPLGSELSEYNVTHEIREYTISIQMFYAGTNIKKNILDHILRKVSHLEALIQNNISMTLTDSSDCFNCRLESTELNTGEDEEYYLVEWVWIGQHMENVG